MKKNMLIMAGLLVLCIAGQVLLKPQGGSGSTYAQALEDEKTADLLNTSELLTKDPTQTHNGNLQGRLFQQFALMLLFVGIIGAGAWFLSKKMAGRWGSSRSRHISVTETVSLGARKQLHIVQVGSKRYLISSAADGIRLLTDVTDVLQGADQ